MLSGTAQKMKLNYDKVLIARIALIIHCTELRLRTSKHKNKDGVVPKSVFSKINFDVYSNPNNINSTKVGSIVRCLREECQNSSADGTKKESEKGSIRPQYGT